MQRRKFTSGVVSLGGLWALAGSAEAAALSEGDATLGVRGALERGAIAAVGLLGRHWALQPRTGRCRRFLRRRLSGS